MGVPLWRKSWKILDYFSGIYVLSVWCAKTTFMQWEPANIRWQLTATILSIQRRACLIRISQPTNQLVMGRWYQLLMDMRRIVISGCQNWFSFTERCGLGCQRSYETRSCITGIEKTIALRNPKPDCSYHTDRGSQYCAYDFQKRLRQLQFQVSMTRKGNYWIILSQKHSSKHWRQS